MSVLCRVSLNQAIPPHTAHHPSSAYPVASGCCCCCCWSHRPLSQAQGGVSKRPCCDGGVLVSGQARPGRRFGSGLVNWERWAGRDARGRGRDGAMGALCVPLVLVLAQSSPPPLPSPSGSPHMRGHSITSRAKYSTNGSYALGATGWAACARALELLKRGIRRPGQDASPWQVRSSVGLSWMGARFRGVR